MVNPLFEISPQQVAGLGKNLRHILNKLLRAEAHKLGINPLAVQTSENDDESDGGVDARVERSTTNLSASRIPVGLSVWQFKSGPIDPKGRKGIKPETQKPGIQTAIQQGGSYCFVIGHEYAADGPTRQRRYEVLETCFKDLNLEPKAHLLIASDIAEWISEYPSIAMSREFSPAPLHDGLYTFDNWSQLRQTRANLPFMTDPSRQQFIEQFPDILQNSSQHIRITGKDGTGKTRLIFEAIRSNNLQDITLYANHPSAIPNSFFTSIAQRSSFGNLILIVDDCSEKSEHELLDHAQRCSNRVSLITLGHTSRKPDQYNESIFHYELLPLEQQLVHQLIQPLSVHDDLAWFVVTSTKGHINLALAMAEALKNNPDVRNTASLTNSESLSDLDLLFERQDQRQAAQAISLLKYIDLYNPSSSVSPIIAGFFGINLNQLKAACGELIRRGLVVRRHHACHVSPRLLAVHLANEVWRTRYDDIRVSLFPQLRQFDCAELLLNRLADLGDEILAAPIVEMLYGQGGEFSNIDNLGSDTAGRYLEALVRAAPRSTARNLHHILTNVTDERLQDFHARNRHIISVLGKLLLFEETFFQAANLILRFAVIESESGRLGESIRQWCQIFQTSLPIGPIPGLERHRLIIDGLSTDNVATRLLAVKAISSALHPYMGGRAVGIEVGGHVLSKHWEAETWGSLWDVWRSALDQLDRAFADTNGEVRNQARATFFQVAANLVSLGLANDILPRLERQVNEAHSEGEKKQLQKVFEILLSYDTRFLSEEQHRMIEQWSVQVLGDNYQDRLYRWIGELTPKDRRDAWRDGGNTELAHVIESLAKEGFDNPHLLQPELTWLFTSANPHQSKMFTNYIGQWDNDRTWFDTFQQLFVRLNRNSSAFVGYLLGRWQSGDTQWVEDTLDHFVNEARIYTGVIYDTLIPLGFSERRCRFIVGLLDKTWLPVTALEYLSISSWMNTMPLEVAQAFLGRIVGTVSESTLDAALRFLYGYLTYRPNDQVQMAAWAFRLLSISDVQRQYIWEQIAELYMAQYPAQVADAVITQVSAAGYFDSDLLKLLDQLMHIAPSVVWPLLGDFLLENEIWFPRNQPYSDGLNTFSIAKFDPSYLMAWAANHQPNGRYVLANLVEIKTSLPDLAHELIRQYGNDDNVAKSLMGGFLGISVGNKSAWLKEKLNVAQGWLQDADSAIQRWARTVIDYIEQEIARHSGDFAPNDDMMFFEGSDS